MEVYGIPGVNQDGRGNNQKLTQKDAYPITMAAMMEWKSGQNWRGQGVFDPNAPRNGRGLNV